MECCALVCTGTGTGLFSFSRWYLLDYTTWIFYSTYIYTYMHNIYIYNICIYIFLLKNLSSCCHINYIATLIIFYYMPFLVLTMTFGFLPHTFAFCVFASWQIKKKRSDDRKLPSSNKYSSFFMIVFISLICLVFSLLLPTV